MQMVKKKQFKLKHGEAKMPLRKNGIRKMESLRFKALTGVFKKTRNDLGEKIQQQADELKKKNGQLKNGAAENVRSEQQVYIRTQAMEAIMDGIFIIDAQKLNFPVIYANRSFQKMAGCSKREILGRNYFLFHEVNANSHIINEIKYTIRKGKSFHGEIVNFKKNGKKCWISLRITPVHNSSGVVTHYAGIQTDVTSMREKELEIDEQREELLHVTRVGKLAEFVSSLAHEISQPLTAILSYSQAAKRMLADRESKVSEILQYVIDDDHRAAEVIQRLRSLLKKSASEMKLLDINTLVEGTVALIAVDATIRNVVLKIESEHFLPLICGDRIQLQQVLLNLISNSFDALENSLGAREILIRTSRKDAATIIVEIKDSGCGIPARNISKLFTRFFTSKPDGLGMGLSISRSIVESHGGRLDIKSNPGHGATFYFTIPVNAKDVA